MMELVYYMTLASLLFSIGIYGALTRRSFGGGMLSLSISVAAIVLAFVAFNHSIQPAEVDGYFFALTVLMLSVVYGAFVVQFVRNANERNTISRETAKAQTESQLQSISTSQVRFLRRHGEGFVGIVAFTDSLAFQISMMIIFVVGYLLMKVSPIAAVAFLAGAGALKYILHQRKNAEQLQKKSVRVADNVVLAKSNKV